MWPGPPSAIHRSAGLGSGSANEPTSSIGSIPTAMKGVAAATPMAADPAPTGPETAKTLHTTPLTENPAFQTAKAALFRGPRPRASTASSAVDPFSVTSAALCSNVPGEKPDSTSKGRTSSKLATISKATGSALTAAEPPRDRTSAKSTSRVRATCDPLRRSLGGAERPPTPVVCRVDCTSMPIGRCRSSFPCAHSSCSDSSPSTAPYRRTLHRHRTCSRCGNPRRAHRRCCSDPPLQHRGNGRSRANPSVMRRGFR